MSQQQQQHAAKRHEFHAHATQSHAAREHAVYLPLQPQLIQFNSTRSRDRAAEGHQTLALQYQSRDMPIGAVLRVFEAEGAFQTEPTVLGTAKTHAGGVYGLIDQLHVSGLTGITTERCRPFRGGAGCAPECEADRNRDHQNQ
jgi:hypothetical protein